MKARTGFAIGMAVGYAIGAGSGRHNYGRPTDVVYGASSTKPAQSAAPDSTTFTRPKAQQLIGTGLRAASKMLREN